MPMANPWLFPIPSLLSQDRVERVLEQELVLAQAHKRHLHLLPEALVLYPPTPPQLAQH
jgi:hypothetical protein